MIGAEVQADFGARHIVPAQPLAQNRMAEAVVHIDIAAGYYQVGQVGIAQAQALAWLRT